MHINLKEKKALVTGASRGIGQAIAQQFLTAGAHVILHFHKNAAGVQQLKEQFPHQTTIVQANLTEEKACQQLFKEALQKVENIDILVNNAAIAVKVPVDSTDENWLKGWQETMNLNLRAVAILSRLMIQHLLHTQRQGRLIHISSRAAFRGDTPEYMAYAASKGGIVALSHTLARAYGKQGIKSFVVAPGFVKTDMAQEFIEEYGENHATQDLSLNQLTEPQDIAPMVTFLASGLADHATGTTISINAGSYVR